HAAAGRERNADQRHQAVAQRIEQPVEQRKNNEQADRDNQLQPRLGIFEVFKLAGPNQAIAARQLHVLSDAVLRLSNRTAEIAIAHAEFDRNVALALLVIDIRGAGIETDLGEFAEPNIGI